MIEIMKEKEKLEVQESFNKVSEEFRSYKAMAQTILKQKENSLSSVEQLDDQILSLNAEINKLTHSLVTAEEQNASLLVCLHFHSTHHDLL